MAKEGLAAVPSFILLSFFFLFISLTASQSVPPYYAGSYLESSSGQERGAEDGDGFVSVKEVLSRAAEPVTRAEATNIIRYVDADKDGKMSFEEYLTQS